MIFIRAAAGLSALSALLQSVLRRQRAGASSGRSARAAPHRIAAGQYAAPIPAAALHLHRHCFYELHEFSHLILMNYMS